jgi:3-phosphoshikimate 1-carboxyvinyltransferase
MSGHPPYLDLGPLRHAAGTVRLPGSKSISNRVLLLAALAEGSTEIVDLLASDDVDRMLEALERLGVQVDRVSRARVVVHGCGGRFPGRAADLNLGNAGTAFRPLTAALAMSGGHYKLFGVARMHERPIGDLVDALRALGADIRYLGNEGFPPLEIRPAIVAGGKVAVRGTVSSQFLTALLMAAPLARGALVIEVEGELISKPYIEITLNLMDRFGVRVTRDGWKSFALPAGAGYRSPGALHVEGDASSASYFLAAGAIAGGPVRVEGVGRDSVQGDIRFAEALSRMGARLAVGPNWIEARAPASGRLKAFDLDLNHIPDAAMTLAVTALFGDGPSRLRNIASWRVKETDRLSAMATELRKVGAEVEEGADYLVVSPPHASGLSSHAPGAAPDASRSTPDSHEASRLAPHPPGLTPHAAIDTYDDHRMAMCFSLVALGGVAVRINDPGCVAKTFPDYFERFAELTAPGAGVGGYAAAAAPVVAIDGPSASGKGTVARALARRLGFHFLDSGALYRLVALSALDNGVDLGDAGALAALVARLDIEFRDEQVFLEGKDVTGRIRGEDVSLGASRVAAVPEVRSALLERQRAFRRPPGLVADGRDMGSVVFPGAELKVFLTATPEERARRRYKQLMDKGIHANLGALLQDINQRDARDAGRSVAPLQKCADAHLLDTTDLSIEQAVSTVLALCPQALKQAPSQ